MPFSPQTIEEKPYNKCINCEHIGKTCDGPNFLAMSIERWAEWCKIRKNYLDWTNEELSEKSGIAKATVDKILSGHSKDIRITTMQQMTRTLVNGSWGKYPCSMAIGVDTDEVLREKCNQLASKVIYLKEQISFTEKQLESKDELLRENFSFFKRKNKIITVLATLLGIFVSIVIAALVADAMLPNVGFFWKA